VRRLALLLTGGLLYLLFLAVAPVFADGGPHQLVNNSGTAGISGDCAACHRAHTAQAENLLKAALPGLCLDCHNGTGATTDVVDGFQYTPDGSGDPTSVVLGALRGGGFSYALIDSSHAARRIVSTRFLGHVSVLPVAQKQATTSTHGGTGTVWGNAPDGTSAAGAGPAILDCASCHNPHGNGQYRILATSPGGGWTGDGVAGWAPPAQAVEIADSPDPTNATRNYTVLPGALASDVVAAATMGDYWRRNAPWNTNLGARDPMQTGWNGTDPTNAAANGGDPPSNGSGLMTAWCIQCHTRYNGLVNDDAISSSMVAQPDVVLTYRHLTMNYGCEQCHVSHGSNALMTGAAFSFTDPAGAVPSPVPGAGPAASPVTSGDSRLLKIDDRGTCQMCHDPTKTVDLTNSYVGPSPSPGVP
jgi:predicted CXXCH cytochrome family protein